MNSFEHRTLSGKTVSRENLEIHLVLYTRDGSAWIHCDASGLHRLPQIEVSRLARTAEEVVKVSRQIFGINIFCLWEVEEGDKLYVVGELRSLGSAALQLRPFSGERLPEAKLPAAAVRVLHTAFEQAFSAQKRVRSEPFKRIDWLDELFAQVRSALAGKGRELKGVERQLNASPTFSLLKIGTTTSPLWFKGVGAPNEHEYAITMELDRLIPGCVPPVVARFPAWNAWVAEEAPGDQLDQVADIEVWKMCASKLADIQIASMDHLDTFRSLGCRDGCASTLRAMLDDFIETAKRAMSFGEEFTAVRLSVLDIERIASAIRYALSISEEAQIPDALVHRDLTGGNVVASRNSCHFLDWAQACIGPPFICYEYLRQIHALRTGSTSDFRGLADALNEPYASRWSGALSPKQIAIALRHAPLLAKYLYVLPLDGTQVTDRLDSRERRRVLRGMTRLMFKDIVGSIPNLSREEVCVR
jgi:hypothetical protein